MMDPRRLASVLDTGDDLPLRWPERPRIARAAARVFAHAAGVGLTFLAALVGAGAAFHLARGPHAHVCSPPICISRG